ncbi:Leucine--tRNA ligase, mitochondrial [Erysiphe neolycopersici]|uniref:leucine--tRNA ligase n=1 Tax=Erysiphe neolycopersici TaxID=212602 RepID=A0A420I3Z3_9PEZI|nr:Leucine--tRNA ligase, mitochondrial [Erysiphe neolycopersici]
MSHDCRIPARKLWMLSLFYQRPYGRRLLCCKTHSSSKSLNLPKLDQKWREKWQEDRHREKSQCQSPHSIQDSELPMYILPMFPYPSGDLHLGHLRVYTISDVLARFYRMSGYNVIHPIGWDAFGLPAENAAIERGIDPKSWTKQNIEKMKIQLESMNGYWDWERELTTCDPSFYKHTQRLFTLLFKNGLAYQAKSQVNYDPIDQTVLANEQVDSNGFSWRSGAKVEKRSLKQWFFRISKYRQELLDGLTILGKAKGWPERVLSMQRNWLGKSSGVQIKFSVTANDMSSYTSLEVFTTRLDTIFGVQYLALAITHPIVKQQALTDLKLQDFIKEQPNFPLNSKVGYELPNIKAINPLACEEGMPEAIRAPLPVFVSPYVIGDYGNGAVMGVPGHDVRDHEFWKQNRPEEPVLSVVTSSINQEVMNTTSIPFTNQGYLTNVCGPFSNMSTAEATDGILQLLRSSDRASSVETWKLKDWLVSRQRYWGTPIPIVHCDHCGPVAVPDDQLPVVLPPFGSHWEKGKKSNPLIEAYDWLNTVCPSCGSTAKRDTDTMDTFVDSSWYFLRFLDPQNKNEFLSLDAAKNSLPVDIYVGGVEHAILHLLYSRFIYKFLSDTYLKTSEAKKMNEPFKTLITQGMVHGKTYTDPMSGRFLKPSEVDFRDLRNPVVKISGQIANVSYEKMSKSKYNGVNPSICREKYGADTMRAHILFQAPVTEVLEWDEEKISGIVRWLRRLYDYVFNNQLIWTRGKLLLKMNKITPRDFLIYTYQSSDMISSEFQEKISGSNLKYNFNKLEQNKQLWRSVQETIKKVSNSYSTTHSLNTVVSDLMALTNTIIESPCNSKKSDDSSDDQHEINHIFLYWSIQKLIKMMAPITPAFSEECWEILESSKSTISKDITYSLELQSSVFSQSFPKFDSIYNLLTPNTQKCAIQINGRLKIVVEIPTPPKELALPELEQWLKDQILKDEDACRKLTCGSTSFSKDKILIENKARSLVDIREAKKIIVVKKGRIVNFVM